MNDLDREIDTCKNCDLHRIRHRVALTSKLKRSGNGIVIYFLSDHPTLSDEVFGRLGVGPERTLLKKLLKDSSDRIEKIKKIYISSMVHCVPRSVRVGAVKKPSPLHLLKCSGYIHKEIKLYKPDLIIFDGSEVSGMYENNYPQGVTIPNIKLLLRNGGTGAPLYLTAQRILTDRLKKWGSEKVH